MANTNNNNKMKGLLKGLRYISQIFDNEKEPEMQIGFPTDVKHVAHIGWDGPAVNSPSWMTEFKPSTAYASAPLSLNDQSKNDRSPGKWAAGESEKRNGRLATNTTARDLPELPKASRRQQTSAKPGTGDDATGITESPTRRRSDKARHRRSTKNSASRDSTDSPRQSRRSTDSNQETDSPAMKSPARNLPEIPKKSSRRKKSKESNASGGSSRSRSKAPALDQDPFVSPFSDPGPGPDKADQMYGERDKIKGLIT